MDFVRTKGIATPDLLLQVEQKLRGAQAGIRILKQHHAQDLSTDDLQRLETAAGDISHVLSQLKKVDPVAGLELKRHDHLHPGRGQRRAADPRHGDGRAGQR